MFFFFDKKIKAFEEQFQWDLSLIYLEKKYLQNKNISILNALVGYSWLYLVEGPIISGKYKNDPNILPLEYWKKYIGIGMNVAHDNSYFNFIAGYTLLLDGDCFESTYAEKGFLLMDKCANVTDDMSLKKLASNFIQNIDSKKHIPLKDGKSICACLFSGDSLLDQYFYEIYAD